LEPLKNPVNVIEPARLYTCFFLVNFASPAGGLRNCNGAALAPFKKICFRIFLNTDFVVTEPKDAPYAITGVSAKMACRVIFMV